MSQKNLSGKSRSLRQQTAGHFPLELRANIVELRRMTMILSICGVLTIIGLLWAIFYFALIPSLSREAMDEEELPNTKYLTFLAVITLPLCIFVVPLVYEIALWRIIGRIRSYKRIGRDGFRRDKIWSKTSSFKKYPMLYIMCLAFLVFIPLPHTASQIRPIAFSTQYVSSSSIELGDSQVNQQGVNGQGVDRTEYISPVLAYLVGQYKNIWYYTRKQPTEITQAPINKIIAKGTKKYQYMWCSNGAYRYYTNDQFKDPDTGFTHKSPDYCAKNNEGNMTKLSNSAPTPPTPPPAPTVIYRTLPSSPTYTTCNENYFGGGFTCSSY